MKKILGLMLLLSSPAHVSAADDFVLETDDQFVASQKARGEGFTAFRAGDHAAALAKMEEALALRPSNTLLLGYVAFLAAETGNLERAAEAARLYAKAGQAPGAAVQGKLAEKLAPEVWAPIRIVFDANTRSSGAAETYALVPNDVLLVEGVAVSPDGDTFVSSVVSGGLYKVDNNTTTQLVRAADHGMGSFFGIAHDPVHNSLFATFARVDQTPGVTAGDGKTGVAEFDAHTGELKREWVLDGTTDKHQIADLLITHDHRIFVSDATGKAVFQIIDNALVKVADLPHSMSPQGLAELDGVLYLADYGRGVLRLEPSTGTATMMAVPPHINLVGIDGLTFHDGQLIAIQNGGSPHRILGLKPNPSGDRLIEVSVLAQALDKFDEPTLGASNGTNYYFVASSQWPKFGKEGVLKEGRTVNPTVILKLMD